MQSPGNQPSSQASPPRWLERLLLALLPASEREPVTGDLLEEYRAFRSRLGHRPGLRANIWYARHVLSFVGAYRSRFQLHGGSMLKHILMAFCAFGVIAGVWLLSMENILKHPGFERRSVIAVCIAAQALATLACLAVYRALALRVIVLLGAAAICWMGASVVWGIWNSPHFEGYALLIGSALVVQGLLTMLVLGRGFAHRAL